MRRPREESQYTKGSGQGPRSGRKNHITAELRSQEPRGRTKTAMHTITTSRGVAFTGKRIVSPGIPVYPLRGNIRNRTGFGLSFGGTTRDTIILATRKKRSQGRERELTRPGRGASNVRGRRPRLNMNIGGPHTRIATATGPRGVSKANQDPNNMDPRQQEKLRPKKKC